MDDHRSRQQLVAEIEAMQAQLEQAQAQLEAYEERLNQLDRLATVGQLAGGIAHDFGNFLTTNIFHVELLLDDARLPPALVPSVQTILNGARRTAQLVRQILDFSRRTTMDVQPVDLPELIREIAKILNRTLPENINITTDFGPGRYVANVDPARIEQVVMNLALNARDAMPQGGDLCIGLCEVETKPGGALRAVELSLVSEVRSVALPAGRWVCLSISDTGTGIAEDVWKRMFEPFFTTKGSEGTGLGLAQVYAIVRQHEGHIGVETLVGSGTIFRVYLPACSLAGEGQGALGISAAPRGHGETILFVEDEKRMREGGQAVLESLGYRVLAAANGEEALEIYRSSLMPHSEQRSTIDLVVTDVVMPRMGGKSLLRSLQALDARVKVLAMTGYATPTELEALAEVGFSGTIRKPCDIDDLAASIRQALDAE